MRLLFAAYDPAISAPFGNFWVWQAPEIPKDLPDRIRSQVIRLDPCREPNSLAQDDLQGGCIAIDSRWCAFYRHYNGGRDLVGRPERGILLVGFASRAEATQQDCSGLLDSGLFAEWSAKQPLSVCPDPPITACDGQFVDGPAIPGTARQSTEIKDSVVAGTSPIRSPSASRWSACRRSEGSEGFHWRIKRTNGVWSTDVVPLPDTRTQTNRIESAERIPISTTARPPEVTQTRQKDGYGRRPFLSGTSKIALGMAFVVGSLVGWAVRGLIGGGISVFQSVDGEAAQRWAQTYQSEVTGIMIIIPRDELVRRLKNNDWSEKVHIQAPEAESKRNLKGRVNIDSSSTLDSQSDQP